MIYESKYWKNTLLKRSKSIRKKMCQKRWSEASYAILEQDIMIGFFIVRKLIESFKTDSTLREKQIQIHSYKLLGDPSTFWNRWEFYEIYDMTNPTNETMKLLDICNQVIHSYHFFAAWSIDEDLEGVYINSDRLRQNRLLEIQLDSVINIFEEIGNNYPNFMGFSGPLGSPTAFPIQGTREPEDIEPEFD